MKIMSLQTLYKVFCPLTTKAARIHPNTHILVRALASRVHHLEVETRNTSEVKFKPLVSSKFRTVQRKKNADGSIVIEGAYTEEQNHNQRLVLETKGACPLCSLNMDIDYTDVLILKQFLRRDGTLLPRRDTGLCAKQQKNVAELVHKAANAGLLTTLQPPMPDGKVRKSAKESRYKFKGLNRYFTDKY